MMAISLAVLLAFLTIPATAAYALLRRLTSLRRLTCLFPSALTGGATLAGGRMFGEYESGFCCYEDGVPTTLELIGYFAFDTLLFSLASFMALSVVIAIWELVREAKADKSS